jgi:hypothetical protein
MPNQSPLLNRKRIALMMTLATLLASVYMLTYSGRIESSDTRALFDTVSSLVHYGDNYLDISAWYNYPSPTTRGQYPLYPSNAEPLQPFLATPLYWFALQLSGIGLNHAVWLFNIFICALSGSILFLYALALGYHEKTALVAALLYGLATIIWPYSKSFFREPLALLLILLTALFIERWRSSGYRSIMLFAGAVVALIGAWLTKEAVIFAVPSLMIMAFPALKLNTLYRRLMTIFLITVLIGVVSLLLVSILPSAGALTVIRTQVSEIIGMSLQKIQLLHVALHSYLLSIGGSFWATSPTVLLAVPGLWMLYRRGHYRYVIALIVLVMTFVGGYAFLREVHWFGGLSWPPRFMIPVIPFLILGTLPVLDRLTKPSAPRSLIALTVMLAIYSVWIQLNGLLLPWETYTQVIPAEAGGLGEWGGGLNHIQYLRWVVLPPLWSQRPLDLAWVRVATPLWPLTFLALALLCAFQLPSLLREETPAKPRATGFMRIAFVLSPILLLIVTYFSLRAIYRDPFYLGERESLHAAMPIIESSGHPGDVMLLDQAGNYDVFFMNYAKFKYPRVVTLSKQPGEQPSPEQPARIQSDNTDALLLKITPPLIQNVASTRDSVWLLEDAGPWLPWRVRPIERYMAAHYYPIRELSTDPPDPMVRLIEYSTVAAPDPFGFRGPEFLADLQFGEDIHLKGATLPEGTTYSGGTILPLSLYWSADKTPEKDYTVAWFLVSEDGSRVIQGFDYQPGWGFVRTSQWQPEVPVWDNRALRLPVDLQPGQYRLWVRLYQSDASEILLPVSSSGETTSDGITGVLPVRIDILP